MQTRNPLDELIASAKKNLDNTDYKAAVNDYTAAINIQPDKSSLYASRGLANLRLGDHLAAIHDANESMRLGGSKKAALHNRGVSKQALGDLIGAWDDFCAALEAGEKSATPEKLEALQVILKRNNMYDTEADTLKTLAGHTDDILTIYQLKDGRLVSGSKDKTVKVWDVDTGLCIQTLKGIESYVWSLCELTDGRLAVGVDSFHGMKLFNLKSGHCAKVFKFNEKKYSRNTYSICQLKDGRLASVAQDDIDLWDINTGKITRTLKHPANYNGVSKIHQLKDSRLISAATDGTIKLWNPNNGMCLQTLTPYHGNQTINAFCELEDGRVISGSHRGDYKFWEMNNGTCLKTYIAHSSYVRSIFQLSDGSIASGAWDKTVRVYDLKTDKIIKFYQHSNYVSGAIQLKDGRIASINGANISVWAAPQPHKMLHPSTSEVAKSNVTTTHPANAATTQATSVVSIKPSIPTKITTPNIQDLAISANTASSTLQTNTKIASLNINPKTDADNSVLHAIIKADIVNLKKCLIQNVNALNVKHGEEGTPLHMAVKYKQNYLLQWLLEQGANRSSLNNSGETALKLAEDIKDTIATTLLDEKTDAVPALAELNQLLEQPTKKVAEFLYLRGVINTRLARMATVIIQKNAYYRNAIADFKSVINRDPSMNNAVAALGQLEQELAKIQTEKIDNNTTTKSTTQTKDMSASNTTYNKEEQLKKLSGLRLSWGTTPPAEILTQYELWISQNPKELMNYRERGYFYQQAAANKLRPLQQKELYEKAFTDFSHVVKQDSFDDAAAEAQENISKILKALNQEMLATSQATTSKPANLTAEQRAKVEQIKAAKLAALNATKSAPAAANHTLPETKNELGLFKASAIQQDSSSNKSISSSIKPANYSR